MASKAVEVMNRCVPIIVILGGTGTGKSKLGIQIAKRIGGEIISADSMQVYKGLDILTNKITEDEKDGVVHHLMDFIVPPRTYTVVDFRNEALPIVDRLLSERRSPIVVGGTNYYIESLLWKVLISNGSEQSNTLLSENKSGSELLAFKLGLRPFSGSLKRKAGEEDKTPLDSTGRFLSMVREVIVMTAYPDKVIAILLDKLQACEGESCKELASDIVKAIGNDDDILKKLESSIGDGLGSDGERIRKNLLEVIVLKEEIVSVVEEWQASNPALKLSDLQDMLLTCGLASLRDLSSNVEETVNDVCQRVKALLAPVVQKLVSQFGGSLRLEIDVEELPSPELHSFLQRIDEEQARSLHPNNKRKIVRSLEVWAEKGRKHSDILNEQKRDGSFLGGPLRYKDIIIFWLTCDKEVLNTRLDERVDEMMNRGLVDELLEFYRKYKPTEELYTRGVFQSIGFKDFRDYLLLDDERRQGPEGVKMLEQGKELFRIATKRYVNQQNKWVRNRFLNCPTREVPPVYNLSTTNVDQWTENVLEPAMDVVMSKMQGTDSSLQAVTVESSSSVGELMSMKYGLHRCDICDRTLVGQLQLDEHLKSARHRKVVKMREKQGTTSS